MNLRRYRFPLSALFLLVILYFIGFTLWTIPPVSVAVGWQPETTLVVMPDIEGTYSPALQEGDVVLSINGQSVQRGEWLFPFPTPPAYLFTLERDGQIVTQLIPVADSTLFHLLTLPVAVLAVAFWIIGIFTVGFAHPRETDALYAGFSWQLIGAGLVSVGPFKTGAPGAWIVAGVLIWAFPVILVWLAFLPRLTPLSATAKKLLWGYGSVAVVMGTVAAIESLWLFPTTSIHAILGVSMTTLLAVLTGSSVVVSLLILLVRRQRAASQSYERQQLTILLVSLALAILPLFFFVVLPAERYIYVPYPLVYSLLLLIPAAYFFVLHRHGHLALDAIFSRIVTIITLVLAIGVAYTSTVFLLDTVFDWRIDTIGEGGFMLVVLSVVIANQRVVQGYVELLLYGRNPLGADTVQEARTRLSDNPEPSTVVDVIREIAAAMSVAQTMVLTKEGEQYAALVDSQNPLVLPCLPVQEQVRLRTRDAEAMSELPEWVALSLPITARGDMLGLFLLSRPTSGYFNARQVSSLQDVADILAFGLLVIDLVDSMDMLSQRALYERQLQRQQIATEIHNEPLHTLGQAIGRMRQIEPELAVAELSPVLRQVTRDLRRIMLGLRPPVLTYSLEWMTKQTVREFAEVNDTLAVHCEVTIESTQVPADTVKMACYYVLEEALNNICKHAQATTVHVSLYHDDRQVHLLVGDDGIGSPHIMRPMTELFRQQHVGVADMHRWASIGKGHLKIKPHDPTGTVIELILPLPPVETEEAR